MWGGGEEGGGEAGDYLGGPAEEVVEAEGGCCVGYSCAVGQTT